MAYIQSKPRPRLSPRQRTGLDNGGTRPKQIIRLYRNSKLGLLPHKTKNKVNPANVLPHPRYPYLKDKTAVSRPKHHQGDEAGFGYAMINAAANLTQLSPKVHATSESLKPSSSSSPFTPLPPLPSILSAPSVLDHQQTQPILTASVSSSSQVSEAKTQAAARLSVPLIVLLSIGLGCVALGLYLLIRFCTRPRRAGRITPSLPILEKAYTYDDESFSHDGKESPVFGGKERSASRLAGEGPLWTWVQYSKPANANTTNENTDKNHNATTANGASGNKRVSTLLGPTAPILPTAALTSRKRVSTASLYRDRDSKDLGPAITGDGYSILDRSKSKLARRSKSYSGMTERRQRDSVHRPDSAYDGADVSSPTTYFQPLTTPTLGTAPGPGGEGRARIQSSYYAVAPYPRLSSLPMSYSIGTAQKVHLSKAYTTERRDTREEAPFHGAETGYTATSPNLTLYPEDSMSVIAAARQKRRSQSEHQRMPKHLGADSGSSKGLLEMEFGVSRMSLSDLADVPRMADEKYYSSQYNTQDKPPRVPSPPPLPSLTQMALAHSHPEAYSNYRSPTYSIYGLYDSDRKSTAAN